MTAFAWLIPPGPIANDAVKYVAMVSSPVNQVPTPFCYRIGVPLIARLLPLAPAAALTLVTYVSVVLASALWWRVGRKLGLSSRALAMAAACVASLQGWAGFLHNPYLTDAAGLLALTAVWAAWLGESFVLALVVLGLGPLLRETVAPMGLLWAVERRWMKAGAALAVASVPLVAVRLVPGMPESTSDVAVLAHFLKVKGPLANLGDAFASYHALWVLAFFGFRWAGVPLRKALGAPLLVTLAVAAALSLLGNTVRMFTLALPFMALAVAQFFEAMSQRSSRLAWALAVAFVPGWFVWCPTSVLGDAVSSHKWPQYVFGALVLLASVMAAKWLSVAPDAGRVRQE